MPWSDSRASGAVSNRFDKLVKRKNTWIAGVRPKLGALHSPTTSKPRVLCFTETYPEFSETYMHEEFVALQESYEVLVVALHRSKHPRRNVLPYLRVDYVDAHLSYGAFEEVNLEFSSPSQQEFLRQIDRIIHHFSPQVMHAHYIYLAWLLNVLAARHDIPYTVRTHSFDMLDRDRERLFTAIEALKSPHCRKAFVYPEFEDLVLEKGVKREDVQTAWPVINTERFFNSQRRAETGGVMCAGPCTPKKAHSTFIDLAASMDDSGKDFRLYTQGFFEPRVREHNEKLGNPAVITFAEPEDMPGVYRQHDWIVYPSDPDIGAVGLPAAVAEAPASGIGVCLQELPGRRAAQLEFLGGAGFLFKHINEVPNIISNPYPEEMRLKGLENSRKFDVRAHKRILDETWAPLLR